MLRVNRLHTQAFADMEIYFHSTFYCYYITYYMKENIDVAAVREIKGRSKDGICCRHCSIDENFIVETLPYILGKCPFGSLLRNDRYHRIRTAIIADEFRKNSKLEVLKELTSVRIVVRGLWRGEILLF